MVKRRDFIGGIATVAAAQLAPAFIQRELAFAQTPPEAGPPPSNGVSNGLVAPPGGGLTGNRNYYLYAGGAPIKDLALEVEVTEDFVADGGFSLQLNAWGPTGANSTWQQYCYGFYTEDKAKPQISWSIENWPSNEYIDHLHETIGLKKPGDMFNLHGERVMVPGPGVRLPAGYKFKILLLHDPKDPRAAVVGAAYTVIDNHGKTIINDRPRILSYKFSHSETPIAPAALDPIVTCSLDVCARAGGVYGFLKSGAAKLTYSAATPLTVLKGHPEGLAAPNTVTAESANTVYSEMPPGPAKSLVQMLSTIKAPAFRPGAPFAVSRAFDADRTDLFAISVSGQLMIFSADGAGRWQKSEGYGPINMAQPNTAIAGVKRFGTENQTGVFLVDQEGQLQTFWVTAKGVEGPIAVGPKDFAQRGAPLAASPQFSARDQTDVFLVDKAGQLNVFWARGASALSGPVRIGPADFANPHAPLAVSQRFGTRETSVFLISKAGTLSRFFVDAAGGWMGPENIGEAGAFHAGASLAAAQGARPEQTNVFIVGNGGRLNIFSAEKTGPWSGANVIGPPALDAGSPIALASQAGRTQADVYVVDRKGVLTLYAADGAGAWSAPQSLGQAGAAPPGAHLAVSPRFGMPNRTEIFVINQTGNATGWPAATWLDKSAWVTPKMLAMEV
jgi:hypothetical protein